MGSERLLVITAAAAVMALAAPAAAQEAKSTIHAVSAEGIGDEIGTIQLADSADGLVIETDLSNLPPGAHGFHLHTHGSCEPAHDDQGQMAAAMGAAGHYDPDNTGKHAGPEGDGHKGDLPVLEVAADGTAQVTLTAPRLAVADARGRALMIHAGGDNYSDEPKPLGGGGARIACGVVE
jgi:superoxide dismutase, Cu-Zn family